MSYWLIVILGIIQGITEFLPISSSAHLLIISNLFESVNNFETAVFLNIGTLLALLWYSRKSLIAIYKETLKGNKALILKLVVALLPAAVLGFVATGFFKGLADNLVVISAMLLVVAVLMLFKSPASRTGDIINITWKQACLVGLAQSVALVPGTSRAGITILAGLWVGLKKETAVAWSFLLAIPIVIAAIGRVLLTEDGLEFITEDWGLIIVGNLVALIIGIISLKFLLKILEKYALKPFAYYRIGLAVLLIGLLLLNIL